MSVVFRCVCILYFCIMCDINCPCTHNVYLVAGLSCAASGEYVSSLPLFYLRYWGEFVYFVYLPGFSLAGVC